MTSSFWNQRNKNQSAARSGLLKTLLPLFVLLLVLAASCSDDPAKIGLGLLPDDDFIEIRSTDTISVRAYTMYKEQSLSSDSTRMIAGGIYDEYFGSTYCDFVTQLRLMTAWPNIDYTIDSVLMTFVPSKVSGDTLATHYMRLCETGKLITDTTDFYSAQDPDTIKYLGEYLLPIMKPGKMVVIKLHNWVGEYLLRDTTQFFPASKFYKEYFRGLYFNIKSTTNPILVEMNAARDAYSDPLVITIFYHSPTTAVKYNYSFVATHRAVNYNRFTHDRSTAATDKQIVHVNDLVVDTAVFIQTYQGVYVRLDLPSLAAFKDVQNLAVNKARIIAPVYLDGETYLEKNMPARIYLRYRDSKDREVVVPDLVHDVGFMDGTYHIGKGYFFNITSFVQRYLQGKIDNPSVELFFPLTATQNVIFKANTNVPAIRFEFAYTVY